MLIAPLALAMLSVRLRSLAMMPGLDTDIQGVVGNGGSPSFSGVAAGALKASNIYSGK